MAEPRAFPGLRCADHAAEPGGGREGPAPPATRRGRAGTRRRQDRGGEAIRVTLDDAVGMADEKQADLVALSDALTALASFDARMSQMVELRFFGGLTVEETADVLKVSPETVMRDWKTSKVWLLRELSQGKAAAQDGGGRGDERARQRRRG